MKSTSSNAAVAAVVTVTLATATGCATTQEGQQAQGAALGALAGGLTTGLLTGNVGYGIAGAVAGAALGWGAVKLYQSQTQQVRSVEQDQQLYGLTPSANSVLVKLNKAVATPDRIAPGQTVTVASDYSLALPGSQANAEVAETYTLKKDGKVLFTSPPQRGQHSSGGYAVNASIPIPKDAETGTYVVETRVEAGTSYDVSQAVFVVAR
jgi:predicted lipid-binding transport protein (Tim44 family)